MEKSKTCYIIARHIKSLEKQEPGHSAEGNRKGIT